MYRVLRCFVCLSIILCAGSGVRATEIIPSTLADMTGVSDTVVTGYVTGQHSYWEGNMIYTKIAIAVQQFEKNANQEAAPTLEVKIMGGQVGDVRFEVDQAPIFTTNEKVLLFLKKVRGEYAIFGLYYGACRIRWDDARQKEFIDGPLFRQESHYQLQTMKKSANIDFQGPKELSVFLTQLRSQINQ